MDRLDCYIEKQKAVSLTASFENKLKRRIEEGLQTQQRGSAEYQSLFVRYALSKAVLVMGVVMGIVLGVLLGSLYEHVPFFGQKGLLVNDYYIENFSHYAHNEDE